MAKLLAIAGLTVRAVVREGAFAAISGLLAAVVWLGPRLVAGVPVGDERSRLLTMTTLGLCQAVLGLAAVWLAADLLGRELSSRSIEHLASTPVAAWHLWVGKWLGLVSLEAGWLLLAAGLVLWQAPRHDPIRQVVSRLLPPTESEVVTVAPGESHSWHFVVPEPGGLARVQCRASSPDRSAGPWRSGWTVQSNSRTLTIPDSHQSLGQPHQIPFEQSLSGPCVVTVTNTGERSVQFAGPGSLELAVRVSWSESNLVRGLFVLWLQLAFLTALGLAAGGALSFPVAAFVLLAYLLMAVHVPFAVSLPETRHTLGARLGGWLCGGLYDCWPVPDLAAGRSLSDRWLGRAVWQLGVLRTGLLMLVGNWLWARREWAGGRS